MTTTCEEAIQFDGTTTRPEPSLSQPASTSAVELARSLADAELEELRRHHVMLAIAVAELSQSAGRDWPLGPDDPTVALLRAVAKLSLVAPDATSGHAAELCRELTADGGTACSSSHLSGLTAG